MLLRLASIMNFTFHLSLRQWEANQSLWLMRPRGGLHLSDEDVLGCVSGKWQGQSWDLEHLM